MSKPKKIAVRYVATKRTKTAEDKKILKAQKAKQETAGPEECPWC